VGLTFQSLFRKKFLKAFDLDTEEGLSGKPFNGQRTSVRQNSSLHENYRDEEPTEAGSDRAFGCTVGSILMLIGATKAFVAGAISSVVCLIFVSGSLLLLLGIVAPSRLSALNRVWLKVATVIAKAVNPIILALLFFLVDEI
jgi:hypothetical protein